MRLIGIGIDVASIHRFRALLDRYGDRFVQRWFDPIEVTGTGQESVILARCFAVKEAVWKALPHSAPSHLPWRNILTSPGGSHLVDVRLRGSLASEAGALGVGAITASAMTHDGFVLAVALVEAVDGAYGQASRAGDEA